jgi:hypothetical protein
MYQNLMFLAVFSVLASSGVAQEITTEQEERETAFSKQYSACNLVGAFTVDGKMDQAPKSERYEIKSVTKLTGNLWTFTVRVKYGKVDANLPITVPVIWAGDTPMVALTNASIPGLGEAFSARVIFYDNRYAGTWQHGEVGGHMFGRIEKIKPDATETSAE